MALLRRLHSRSPWLSHCWPRRLRFERRRTLPLEIYPIKSYGALEVGSHRFCHEESGKTECGTFHFAHLWRQRGDQWRISRVLSYGH